MAGEFGELKNVKTASDVADWWEANRKYLAGYTDRELARYVEENPGLFAVVVATAAQTAVEFPLAIGSGFVDILNLGKGAAEGGFGYLQDGLRFLSAAAPLARGAQAVLNRVLAMGALNNCTWIAAAKAMQITGARPFAMVRDLARAAGIRASATDGAFIDELIGVMRQLGARVRLLRNPSSLSDVTNAARANKDGAVVFSVQWKHPAFGPDEVGHSLVAVWDAARNMVRYADRTGKVFDTIAEFKRFYPGIDTAVPYGTMAFIENAILPQAALVKTMAVSTIYDVLALELKVVFSPAPELIEQVRKQPKVTLGEPTIYRMYTVVAGDSLSKIAQRYYNDMLLWPLIYNVNRAVIGPNHNRIEPGQRLKIPDLTAFSPRELTEARERGRNWRR